MFTALQLFLKLYFSLPRAFDALGELRRKALRVTDGKPKAGTARPCKPASAPPSAALRASTNLCNTQHYRNGFPSRRAVGRIKQVEKHMHIKKIGRSAQELMEQAENNRACSPGSGTASSTTGSNVSLREKQIQ